MSEPPTKIRVLHVDDEPDFADLAATFLEREDDRLDVFTAISAEEGREFLTGHDVDCIVSDYDMPGQDGLAFLETVRKEYPDLPFILFTGKGSEEVASEAIKAGVTAYFQKESGTDQYAVLAKHITNAVESSRSRETLDERTKALQRYERIVNSMLEAASIYDENGRFAVVNDHLAEWYGTTTAELEGKPSTLVSLLRDQQDEDPFQELLDGERDDVRGEVEGEFPGHGHAVLEFRLTPLSEGEAIDGVVGVTRDITERRERERELEQAKREYQELFNGMNDTAWVISTDARFLLVNDAAVESLGYSREELLSMSPQDIDASLDSSEITELVTTMPDDEIQVFETVHETKDGEHIPVEISSSLIPFQGTTAILSIARDISERTEREEELEQFASIVSHDLRNPLTVAQGRLELAAEECDSEHLGHVTRAHERMNALIDDLLALTRDGDQLGERESVSLPALARGCWQNVATARGDLAVTVDRTIEADRSRLQQLLENLFRNAVEHGSTNPDSQARQDAVEHSSTSPRSSSTRKDAVEHSSTNPPSQAPEDAVEHGGVTVTIGELEDGFYVEDDGPGIPEDERDAVFDSGYSTGEDGTGFGLAIVEQIADAHGWNVRITDGAAGGARFEITGVEFTD